MGIASGPVFQVAWVVTDLEAAEKEFGARYGVENWVRIPGIHFAPETCRFRGAPADFTIDSSMGYAGGQQVELITPVTGESLYTEALAQGGPGLHHIAWVPDDFDAAVAELRASGVEILQHGVFAEVGMESVYYSGGPLGSFVELLRLSPQVRGMFDGMVPEGYRNPWHAR
ncbi:VOC family protein [Nocardia sp. ET3-3]|uniref:VOC family protein n=1 Tax=Nocardia terrae TaxID=2675851 RepID=A0A7K1V4L3_9NOCA|nr:VOC family protein [Nocardia terrae]MVU81431.1 VOC family protein [Nocardia terrae]